MVAETIKEKEYTKMEGKYTFAGFDIDTTGRRLIDEIVQIAAYTPEDTFSQHIMPLMNLNPGARTRHQIRVITVGFFRMLKSMETYKVIKTKTEIATIMEFLAWLEKTNGDRDGIILIYHEQQKLAPYMLIEKMKKFNLDERFNKIVKAFVNGYDLCGDDQKGKGLKYLTLSQNFKVHADCLGIEAKEPEEFEGNAAVRAKLSYEICKMMSFEGEKKDLDDDTLAEQLNKFIASKALPMESELDELVDMEESLTRQTEMRDIFLTYFSTSRYHRRRALDFRRALAEAKHDKNTLQEIWNAEKREGMEKLVKGLESIKDEDRDELINILDHHFDEEKKPFKPIDTRRENNGNGGNHRNNNGMNRRRNNRKQNDRNGGDNRGGPRSNSRFRNRSRNNSRRRNGDMNNKNGRRDQQQQYDSNPNIAIGAN